VRVSRRIDPTEVDPPAHLTKDAEAWWREVAPALAQAGILDSSGIGHRSPNNWYL